MNRKKTIDQAMTPKLPNFETITRLQLWTALPDSPAYWLSGEYGSIVECLHERSKFLKGCTGALCMIVKETKTKMTIPLH